MSRNFYRIRAHSKKHARVWQKHVLQIWHFYFLDIVGRCPFEIRIKRLRVKSNHLWTVAFLSISINLGMHISCLISNLHFFLLLSHNQLMHTSGHLNALFIQNLGMSSRAISNVFTIVFNGRYRDFDFHQYYWFYIEHKVGEIKTLFGLLLTIIRQHLTWYCEK